MFGGLLKTKLYPHQQKNLEFHLNQDRTADFSDMGVGKTLTALAKIAHLVAKGDIKKTLIICPMSAIPVWEKEVKKHTNLYAVALKGQLFEKGELMTKYPHEDIYIISYDSIPGRKRTKSILLWALIDYAFDMVICDEVSYIKNYETLRFRAVVQLCDRAKHVLFLTGTPIAGRPDTIFNIYRAMDRGATFGTDFYKARSKYFHNVGTAFPKWIPRDERKDELTHKLYLRAVRSRKDECLSLPPKVFLPRYCDLTKEVQWLYDPVAEELLKKFKIGEHKFRITTPLVKLSKLSQICSGFMYDNSGRAMYISPNVKVDLLNEVLEEIGDEKVIIYTRWREDAKIVEEAIRRREGSGEGYRILIGGTKDRGELVEDFQTKPEVKVFIANITVGGYAITLTAASYVIYFSLNFALTDWLQSQDRIHRVGQTKTCFYIPLLCSDTIDEYIYQTLEDKVDLSTSIIDPDLIEKLGENLENSGKPLQRSNRP
jgi:SNF2 family DNA or RNA helicase